MLVSPSRLVSAALFALSLVHLDAPLAAQFFRTPRATVSEAQVRAHMGFLASDALQGRGSGTRDEWLAAAYIASAVQQWGLEPAGDDDGFLQRVETTRGGQKGTTWNVVARLGGRSRVRSAEALLLSAHLDHLGTRGSSGDVIFNGADDDASGVTAVLELARVLAQGPRLDRTVYFAWFGSEETGGAGSRYFADHPPLPLTSIVANIQFEMIGRPDPKVPAGTLWLTGFERSTLGAELARRGAKLVADPHPEQNFFARSDNIQFAYRGVVAHTISSYGLHREYHTVADELGTIDYAHMTTAIRSLVEPIRSLANSSMVPAWYPEQQPRAPVRRPGA